MARPVEQGAGRRLGAKDGHHGQGLGAIQPQHRSPSTGFGVDVVEPGQLSGIGDDQAGTRRQQRDVGEASRGQSQEAAAGPGQGAHGCVAVAFEKHRRRAPGGVTARLILDLEQHHRSFRGKLGRQRSAGHSSPEDDDIGLQT